MSKTNMKTQKRQVRKQLPNKQQNKQSKSKQGKQGSPKQASVAAAYATRSEGRAPRIQASRDTCNIKHREFIGNVSGSTLFQISQNLSVNPGLSTTFPWLSIMAQAWEQYKFRKLKFVFLTRTGSNTPGSVIMSPDYDSSDAAPATEQIMSTYDGTREDAPWKDNSCDLKINLLSGAGGSRKFVRTGALIPNQDVKLYDVANMYVATVDGTNVAWGKLWVEYDIDFWVPQLPPAGLSCTGYGGRFASGGSPSPSNPLGPTPTSDLQNVGISVNNASRITFDNPGLYILTTNTTGTGLTSAVATAVANCTINPGGQVVNGSASGINGNWQVTCLTAGATVDLTVVGTTVSASSNTMALAPLNSFVNP